MTKKWWKAAGIRAVKTVAQAAVAAIGTTAMLSEVDWLVVGSTEGFNGMWEDLMTREQLVTVLYRFAQMMGQA